MIDAKSKKNSAPEDENKRHFFKGLSLLLGTAAASHLLGGNAMSVALAYTPKADTSAQAGKVLSQAHMVILRDICSQVIPKTDTDGAAEVDTHGFIDNQLFHCYKKNDQQQVISVLSKIDEISQNTHKQMFSKLNPSQQLSVLMDLEQSNNGFNEQDFANFKFLKGQLVFGYYTSEVGASKELKYLHVPGGFKGSIPYDSVGTAWGSMRSYF